MAPLSSVINEVTRVLFFSIIYYFQLEYDSDDKSPDYEEAKNSSSSPGVVNIFVTLE